MAKHPNLSISPTSTPPEIRDYDATEPAQNSPQGTRHQSGEVTGADNDRSNNEVVGRHLDEIAARRRKLLERLAET
jgi:hypothetical protein